MLLLRSLKKNLLILFSLMRRVQIQVSCGEDRMRLGDFLNRLEDTAKLQRKILNAMAPLVKRGGILLYSTCSVEAEEDQLQVERFLQEHPDFVLEDSQLLLPDFMHDGAFAARLRKR